MRKSIVFITGSLTGGGAERVISILANGCAELGNSVKILVLRNKQSKYPVSNSVKVVQCNKAGKMTLIKRVIWLHKEIRDSNSDVIIPFLPIVTLYTYAANLFVGKRIITSERSDPNIKLKNYTAKDRIANFMFRKLKMIGLADWIVFQTPDAQKCYSKAIRKKSSIIPNPLDISRLPQRFEGAREKRIIAAGRFSEEKNFPMLIRAFAAFHNEFPEYILELCGEGNMRCVYQQLISELGIEQYVDMPGFVSDLATRMNRAAMYISTSNHEGISNSMLEALGMGVPTIVTDCPVGGARMFVKNDENGILISMNDEEALLDGMRRVIKDPEFADKISRNAMEIQNELAAEKICNQWMKLI